MSSQGTNTELTEKEQKLRDEILAHGYTYCRFQHYKSGDRIIFGHENINLNLKLRGHLADLALEVLIKACRLPQRQITEYES
jgi:hypothetical protein